jgi:hypothetical protein
MTNKTGGQPQLPPTEESVKVKKLRRTKTLRQAITVILGIAALVIAALVFILVSVATYPTKTPKFVLTSDTGFSIASTISSSPTNQIAALLYPGVQRYLWYTAHNPLKVPITVTSISIAAVMPPAGCPTSNLDYGQTTFTGSLVVPPSGTNAVSVPIAFFETHTNRDSCENTTFNFSYEGTATYTEVYATTTAVTSLQDQSGVTYRATVTASAATDQDPAPSSPTGTVTFTDGTTTFCTVTLTANATAASTATCGPITASSVKAVYTNNDGNFIGSSGTGS